MSSVSFHGLAAGGEGVGRDENGRAVFAHYTAPGDRAHIRFTEESARWSRGELVSLEAASSQRVPPPCPYFGPNALARGEVPCGGCDWQHLDYPQQLEAKRTLVTQALLRIGRIADAEEVVQPCVPSPPFGYRNKASFVARDSTFGFRARGSHEIIDIEKCLIQGAANNEILAAARAAIARGFGPQGEWKLTAREANNGESLVILTAAPWPLTAEFAAALSVVPNLVGVLMRPQERAPLKKIWGRAWLEETIAGLSFRVRGDAFFQTNTALVPELFSRVIESSRVGAGEGALDLFCGTGLFSLGLARAGAEVIGIERSQAAIEDARANAARNKLNAQFIDDDVARALSKLPDRKWDVAILDPPRAGAAAAIPALLKLAPSRIVYVSCDPATLARDIATLASSYRLRSAQPQDLFPQTAHVETIALLEKA